MVIILIIVLVYLAMTTIDIKPNAPTLYPFSNPDVRFDPFPNSIDINNPHKCTGTEPRICNLTDGFSCIGCQSLFARCVEITDDISFFRPDGTKTTLPRTDPGYGYCLTIDDELNVVCNVFHGDLAIIQLSPDAPESMFFCNCRAPGLIGNESILGACDTVFMCNGNIDKLNQPLDDINCVCDKSQLSVRRGDIPSCRTKTVDEASRDGTLSSLNLAPRIQMSLPATRDNFNTTIVDNINIDMMLSPCGFCPVTGARIPNHTLGNVPSSTFCTITYDAAFKSSRNEYFGIPYRRNRFNRLLRGDGGPDCVLGVYWYEVIIYTRLNIDADNNFIQRMIFKFEYSINNHQFYTNMRLDPTKKYAIKTDDLLLNVHILIPELTNQESVPGSRCTSTWPFYTCLWEPNGTIPNVFTMPPGADIDTVSRNSNRIFMFNRQNIPSGLLWGTDQWVAMQRLNTYITRVSETVNGDELLYVTFGRDLLDNVNRFASEIQMIAWGFSRVNETPSSMWRPILVNNGITEDWERVSNRILGN